MVSNRFIEIKSIVNYSTIAKTLLLITKDVNESLSILDYAIHQNTCNNLSIYELGETWIYDTLKDRSKKVKSFASIAASHYFSDNISRKFIKYNRCKRGSNKYSNIYKSYIRTLKILI